MDGLIREHPQPKMKIPARERAVILFSKLCPGFGETGLPVDRYFQDKPSWMVSFANHPQRSMKSAEGALEHPSDASFQDKYEITAGI